VFAASGGTFYGDVARAAKESEPGRPKSPYGISKFVGEEYLKVYAQQYGLEVVILRYGNVYGPRQNPHGEAGVVSIFCRNLLQGAPITIFGDGGCVRDYVYVRDVAQANVLAMQNTDMQPGDVIVVNIGTGTGLCVSSIAHIVRKEVAQQFPDIKLPETKFAEARTGDLRSSVLDVNYAKEKLNWIAETTVTQGIKNTVEWFAGNLRQIPALQKSADI
jgi:UDP-glucose 4-epimerase